MNDSNKRTGGCLCGAVTYDVTLKSPEVHVCHCRLCQKWDGGPSLSVDCEPGWTISGEDKLTWYDSSDYAQRGFCGTCGAHLFFRMKDGSYSGLSAGSLDNQESLKIGTHIYVDKKPPYYDFADDCPRLTEEEFLQYISQK